jgi:FMN-dependent NADH-azoreductase
MKLLHLDSSIMGEGSASRAISAAMVERLRETDPI